MVLSLLEKPDFEQIKQDETNHPFVSWLPLQNGRDDLIGDVVCDLLQDSELSSFGSLRRN